MVLFNTPLSILLFYMAAILAFIAIVKYLVYKNKVDRIDQMNCLLDLEATAKSEKNAEILNGGLQGAAGEAAMVQAVDEALSSMGVWFCTNKTAGFPDAVLLPRGKQTISREIDLLVVTSFGVYLLEAKNWKGFWTRGDTGKLQGSYDGVQDPDQRAEPLWKSIGKLDAAIENIQPMIAYAALIVNTHPKGKFDPKLDSRFLHINELAHFFRRERDKNEYRDDKKELCEALFATLDPSPTAKHDHMMRLPPDTQNIRDYQANHARLTQLSNIPRVVPPVMPGLEWLIIVAGVFFAGAALLHYTAPKVMVEQATAPIVTIPQGGDSKKLKSRTQSSAAKAKNSRNN